jgi:hypothetical protein
VGFGRGGGMDETQSCRSVRSALLPSGRNFGRKTPNWAKKYGVEFIPDLRIKGPKTFLVRFFTNLSKVPAKDYTYLPAHSIFHSLLHCASLKKKLLK